MNFPLLSLIVWLPILAGALLLFFISEPTPLFASSEKKYDGSISFTRIRWFALCVAVLTFVFSLLLVQGFHIGQAVGFQWVEQYTWLDSIASSYYLGVDGLSIWFIVLNAFITIWVIAAIRPEHQSFRQYIAAFLILAGLMNGVFAALDGLLFYFFFEATLIPMYLIIGIWGGKNRIYAAIKFFLYTLLGSLLFLAAVIYLGSSASSFSISDWQKLAINLPHQIWIFFAFLAAFAVKVPMWPVHTWLPDAHVEAPTEGSMVLAAIMLKLGTYGFLRFSLPIVPDASRELAWLMITLSLIAIIYIGFVALVQKDMKKLVAYSSIAHMGFATLGLFLFEPMAVNGAIVQMLSHGVVSAAMFYCIGVLYHQTHTRQISDYGGVVNTMPKFSALFLVFIMANCGLPATSGFIGEFMVIMGAAKPHFIIAILAATSLIVGAAYSLWLYKRVIYGKPANEQVKNLVDINANELIILVVLAITTLFIGIYPKFITDILDPAVNQLLIQIQTSKL